VYGLRRRTAFHPTYRAIPARTDRLDGRHHTDNRCGNVACALPRLARLSVQRGAEGAPPHPITPVCNRYASDIRKAGMERDYYGFDEWSETRINPMLGNAVLEVFPKSFGPVIKPNEDSKLEWSKMRWGLPGPPQFGGAPVTNIRNIKS